MFLRLFLRSPFVVFGAVIMALTVDVKASIVFVCAIPLLFVAVAIIMKLTLLPTAMFIFGWVLVHLLSVFSNLQQLLPEKIRGLRIAAVVLLALLILIPMPLVIFHGIAGYRSYVYHNVSMSFPYIPVYTEVYWAIHLTIFKMPFLYSILGGICWVLALPNITHKTEDTPKEN